MVLDIRKRSHSLEAIFYRPAEAPFVELRKEDLVAKADLLGNLFDADSLLIELLGFLEAKLVAVFDR